MKQKEQSNHALKSVPLKAAADPVSRKERVLKLTSNSISRILGILIIAMSATFYVQIIPLAMVFSGGYLGIQPGLVSMEMDTLIWIFTALAIIVPMVYVFIKWVKYIWMRFVVRPFPFYLSALITKKHA